MQATRTDVLGGFVYLPCGLGDALDAVFGEFDVHPFGRHQRLVLHGDGGIRLGQDALEVVGGQRLQLNADRQTPLQFRDQIGWAGHLECAGGDKQDVVGLDHPMFGGDGAAFHQRQQVALYAFAGDVRAGGVAAALTDFVDFVDKDDTVLLYSVDGFLLQLFRIDQFGRFFFNQQLHRVFDFQLTRFLLLAAEDLEHGLQLAGHLFHARRGHDFNAHRRRSEIDFNLFIVQLAFTQFFTERLARCRRFLRRLSLAPVVLRRWDQHVKHALFRQLFRAVTVLIDGLHANHFDRRIGQIADDGVHFFTDIAHFGELRRFNFDKRRVSQF